ncbi:unnamed protein product [Ambrosiozyma monospora]|uniref:Unnamed protein product n=1 Tax=Ambrosiozyma monospora TaxID=43982 RepID=A0ACB5T476_AMBMO|nr:unnamed protein product [Ambrosiozyma monospora]
MKLVSKEEISAQSQAVLAGGVKGLLLGTAFSLGIFALAPHKYPRLLKMPWSVKTAIFVTPLAFTASVNAELCSSEFDNQMYSSEFTQKKILDEHKRWNSLSFKEKTVETLSDSKYKIITGLWALSLYGSWAYANRDPLMTRAQKLYQARMYAQFITVALLLGSIGLQVYEEKHNLGQKESREDQYLKEFLSEHKS